MRGCSINAEQVLLECSRCALLMPTLARKSANPGHMSPKFLRCAGCMDCASRRGRILREGGARKQRLLASEKSRPATRSSAALVRLGDAQEAPSNRRLRAAWLARVRPRWQLTSGRGSSHTLNSWPRARLTRIAVALHDRCRRGHRRPRRRCNCRRRHCWRAAAAAGPPPHFCYQTAVNESQKCNFFSAQGSAPHPITS